MSTYPHISTNEIRSLKLAAKSLKRKSGISHSEALDQVAREKGFNSWSHLQHVLNSLQAQSSFELLLSGPVPSLRLPSKKMRDALEKTMSAINNLMLDYNQDNDLVCNWLDDDPNQIRNMVAYTIKSVEADKVRLHFEDEDVIRALGDISHSDRATGIIQDLCFLIDGEGHGHAH
nr:hypothetical protein [Halomonas sp.]